MAAPVATSTPVALFEPVAPAASGRTDWKDSRERVKLDAMTEDGPRDPAPDDAPDSGAEPSKPERLADLITEQLATLVDAAIEANHPIEVDPLRGQIFELFVAAEAAGLVDEDSGQPLASGELTRRLGIRWNLGDAMEQVDGDQSKLSPVDLDRVRRLWSLLRMWLEWSYAWKRWPEFHLDGRTVLEKP